MTFKVKATFDPGVTMSDIARVLQRMGIGSESPASGMIAHDDMVENGRIVFVEEWESQAAYESFVNEVAIPAFQAEQVSVAHVTVL